MNYRNEAIRTLQDLATKHPDYGLGDLLYACFQKSATKNKQSLSFLRQISDEDLYTEIEKAIKREDTDEQ